MTSIAPSEKDHDNAALGKRLWEAADQFRANSGLNSQEYSAPVLSLIFLRLVEVRFAAQRATLAKANSSSGCGSRLDELSAYYAEGILYLLAEARFDYLLNGPEAENIGAVVNAAVRDIGEHNPQLVGVLPKTYNLFTSTLLKGPLKKVSEIPASLDYDAYGRIFEIQRNESAPCGLDFNQTVNVGHPFSRNSSNTPNPTYWSHWLSSLRPQYGTIRRFALRFRICCEPGSKTIRLWVNSRLICSQTHTVRSGCVPRNSADTLLTR
jgi:hypothetical protein